MLSQPGGHRKFEGLNPQHLPMAPALWSCLTMMRHPLVASSSCPWDLSSGLYFWLSAYAYFLLYPLSGTCSRTSPVPSSVPLHALQMFFSLDYPVDFGLPSKKQPVGPTPGAVSIQREAVWVHSPFPTVPSSYNQQTHS